MPTWMKNPKNRNKNKLKLIVGLDWCQTCLLLNHKFETFEKNKRRPRLASLGPLSQSYHKPCELPNPVKLGKFRGGLGEFGTHGDGTVKLHALATIATLHLFFFFPFLLLFFFLLFCIIIFFFSFFSFLFLLIYCNFRCPKTTIVGGSSPCHSF